METLEYKEKIVDLMDSSSDFDRNTEADEKQVIVHKKGEQFG
jgi:hypothetical protein